MVKIYFIGLLLTAFLADPVTSFSQEPNWYKCFSGMIGKYPVTLHLHKMQNYYAGYYYYNSTQEPIYMTGNDTTFHDGKIRLYPFVPDKELTNEIFILAVSGNSCKGTWQKNETSKILSVLTTERSALSLSFDMIYLNAKVKLRPLMKESPEAFYEAGTIWPRQNSGAAKSLRKLVTVSFGDTLGENDIKKILPLFKDQFLKDYLDDLKNIPDSEMVEYPFTYNMDQSRWLIIAYQTPKLLVLADWFYIYSGGAHGTSNTAFTCFDLTRAKKIRLTDVLLPAGINKLNGLLEKYFRISHGLNKDQDLTDPGLFENKIERNDNFYLTSKGIGFNYAPYEIAAYAFGEINIFIPFTALANYMQPAFRKLIQ